MAGAGTKESEGLREELESYRQLLEPKSTTQDPMMESLGGAAELWELKFRETSLGANLRIQFW
ncbi:hypothetical protein DKY64_01255 [Stenotrophomonas maltophilia]|nr:hypothetical protein DKY64_01255 [Stenotrophomonas maltophilia]